MQRACLARDLTQTGYCDLLKLTTCEKVDLLKLTTYEKVAVYVLCFSLYWELVRTSNSSMRDKDLTITTMIPQKALYMPEIITLNGDPLRMIYFEMRTLT